MRADEAQMLHRMLEITQALHAAVGIEPGETREAIGMRGADLGHALVGDFERTLDVEVAGPDADQQRPVDAGPVHFSEILLDRTAVANLRRHPHLRLERVVDTGLVVPDFLLRMQVDDNVDRAHATPTSPA